MFDPFNNLRIEIRNHAKTLTGTKKIRAIKFQTKDPGHKPLPVSNSTNHVQSNKLILSITAIQVHVTGEETTPFCHVLGLRGTIFNIFFSFSFFNASSKTLKDDQENQQINYESRSRTKLNSQPKKGQEITFHVHYHMLDCTNKTKHGLIKCLPRPNLDEKKQTGCNASNRSKKTNHNWKSTALNQKSNSLLVPPPPLRAPPLQLCDGASTPRSEQQNRPAIRRRHLPQFRPQALVIRIRLTPTLPRQHIDLLGRGFQALLRLQLQIELHRFLQTLASRVITFPRPIAAAELNCHDEHRKEHQKP